MHDVRYAFFSVILEDNCWVKIRASFPFQKKKIILRNIRKTVEKSNKVVFSEWLCSVSCGEKFLF